MTHREVAARLYPRARLIDVAPIHPPEGDRRMRTAPTTTGPKPAEPLDDQPPVARDQRAEVITGLRGLIDLLEANPGLPTPRYVFAIAEVPGTGPEAQREAFMAAIRDLEPQKVNTERFDAEARRELAGGVDYVVRCPSSSLTTRQVDMEQTTDGIRRRVEIVEEPDWEALGVPA